MDQSFTWDEAKRRKNIRKHGIDFFDAITIFNGEILIIEDTRFNYGEIRYIALGLMRRIVIVVVFTERGEVIRIISARKATKNEERRFYEQIGN